MIVLWAAGAALAAAALTAASVHFDYARRGLKAAKEGLRIARAAYWSRLGQLAAVVLVLGALAWVIASGRQR